MTTWMESKKNLYDTSKMLADKYGEYGTPMREKEQAKALAWYYGEILSDRRKQLNITQKELAERIGKERSYISKIEKGETDMQLSSFLRIATALGLTFDLQPKE